MNRRSGTTRILVSVFLLFSLGPFESARTHPIRKAEIEEAYAKLPLSFEANQGQTDRNIKFLSRGPGFTIFLAPTEVVLSLTRNGASPKLVSASLATEAPRASSPPKGSATVVRWQLLHANPRATVAGMDELRGKINYFLGQDPTKWRRNIPTYAKVRAHDVYPGVDVVYYGTQRQVEFDVLVAPSADPDAILFHVEGADRLVIDRQGDLVLQTRQGTIRQQKPFIYQDVNGTRKEIRGGFVLKGPREVGFLVGEYDRMLPLIIDPVLSYSTYLGGSLDVDEGLGIAVDTARNVYVTGRSPSSDFPTTAASVQPVAAGNFDVFVTKLNPDGSGLVYSTYLGGTGGEYGLAIAADNAGNAYVTGLTALSNFPTTPGAFQTTLSGYSDAFVTKLDPTGSSLIYSTFLGGTGYEEAWSIAVDGAANAYVTGLTTSSNFPISAGVVQTVFGGGNDDAFVTKVNPTGSSIVYSTFLGGGDVDEGKAITVNTVGDAYVTGRTLSSNFPMTVGAFQQSPGGSIDVFVTRLNSSASALVYSTYLGGSNLEQESFSGGIAIDTAGNAYVTGETRSSNFPTTSGSLQPVFSGIRDAFVTKVNATGTGLVYSTYLGGSDFDQATAIALDSESNAYVAGSTYSSDFPTTAGAFQTTLGFGDVFVTKVNPAGSALVYSTYLGGSDYDFAFGIAVDGASDAYVTGATYSSDFPTTSGAFQSTFGGGFIDAYVAKIVDVVSTNVMYGVNSGDDGLSIIDTNTGQTLFLGPLSSNPDRFTTPTSMAVRPSDKKIFVWNNSAVSNKTGELLTVDTCTARGTAVSPPTPSQGVLGALAFAPDGTLFGAAEELSRIDPSTGVRTVIGLPFGARIDGLEFTPDGRLYGVELAFSRQRLFVINTTNGVATVVATLNENIGIIGSIVFNPATAMFLGSSFAGPNGEILFDLNPSDGVVSNVRRIIPSTGFFSGAPQGLGFAPSCINLPVKAMLSFFDAAVASGRLQGAGSGESGDQRLKALRALIASVGDLLLDGKTEEACAKLKDALERTDGNPRPADFVIGPAALELAQRLTSLRSSLGCT